jgi:pimeloyl-ACP methyl ester carboxylesterase
MAVSRFADVDGVRTHYLEAGSGAGAPLVLLHGGAWGECAATAWPAVIDVLASGRHVIAPDWLGFGETDKIVDFADRAGRMISHLGRLLDLLGVGRADVAGLSMGGSHLLRDQASDEPVLQVRRMILVSAGGPPVSGQALAALMDFDGTAESMRNQIRLAFADPAWALREDVVASRLAAARLPGAYEVFGSLRLRAPGALPPPLGDPVRYDRIRVPVLVTAGSADRLKPTGFAREVASRLPDARLVMFEGCGHCPQLEAADAWNDAAAAFLDKEAP